MPSWLDQGVICRLYISTSGDFVRLGTKTDYPFTAGGGGYPSGWTQYLNTGALATDVSWTTSYGRFSIANADAANVHDGKHYGIYRDFNIIGNKRYLVTCQARTTQGRTYAIRYFSYAVPAGGSRINSQIWTYPDWEDMAWNVTNVSDSTMRIYLFAAPYLSDPAGRKVDANWGIQFTNFAITEIESSYPAPTWHEVTCDVKSIQTHYGRDKFTGRYDVASANISINNDDGEFTYREVHPWNLRPGRFIKATLTESGGQTFATYYGLIDSLNGGYSLDGHVITTLSCVDVSSLLSNINVPTYGSEATTYVSGGRFKALLNASGWIPSMYSVDAGTFVQQHILATARTIRDELGLIADSEGCLFYTDRSGILTYRDRSSLDNITLWNTVQAELLAQCPDPIYMQEVKYVFPGVTGNAMSAEYRPEYSLTDMDIYVRLQFTTMAGAEQRIAGQAGIWSLQKQSGSKNIVLYTTAYMTSSLPLPFNDGDIFWLRVAYTDSTRTTIFSTCPDQGSDEIPGANYFTQLGTARTVTNPLATGQQPMRIGASSADNSLPFNGRLYRLTIKKSPTNYTTVFEIYPALTPGTVGQSLLRLPNGSVVTVYQTGSYIIVQSDPDTEWTRLIEVDGIPTDPNAAIVLLRDLAMDWSRDRVLNELQLANAGGTSTQWEDFSSQQKYGPRTYQRLDFVNDDTHPEYLQTRANDLMTGWTEAMLRVNSVAFNPTADIFKWAMTVFLNDLVRIRYQHPNQGWGYAVVSHVQGITQELTVRSWSMTLNVDQPESFVSWDSPPGEQGWDIDSWDIDIWDGVSLEGAYWSSGQVWTDPDSKWGT